MRLKEYTELKVSEVGMGFLHHINDYSVGGEFVTPGIESYSFLQQRRRALACPEDWLYNEAVHINPAAASLRTAFDSLGWRDKDVPDDIYVRVVLLDFDIYDKNGQARSMFRRITPESLIDLLNETGYPLPYCIVKSGTPGNFHALWVLKTPMARSKNREFLPNIYTYWESDLNYTNSTMRNPIHAEQWLGTTTWWTAWSDTPPLLDHPSDLLPEGFILADRDICEEFHNPARKNSKIKRSKRGLLLPRMSEEQLLEAMKIARDGDGRWYLLRSWMNRAIFRRFQETDRPYSPSEIEYLANSGNQIFSEPMTVARVQKLASYWSPQQQVRYVARQRRAGHCSDRSWAMHKEAVIKHFRAKDLQALLKACYLEGTQEVPAHLQERDRAYTGPRVTPNRRITSAYLAWMLGVEDKDVVDPATGEVLRTIPAAKQVVHALAEGKRKGYEREAYQDYLREEEEEPLLEETEESSRLTNTPKPVKLNKYVHEVPQGIMNPIPITQRRKLLYDC